MEFSDIELTEKELAEAIVKAKAIKSRALQLEVEDKNRRDRAKLLTEPFSVESLIDYCRSFYIERFNMEFIIDSENIEIVKKLAMYFTNDIDFNSGSFSLKKGLLIMGNVGTGKTELMKFFQKNKKRCFAIKTCNDISEEYLDYDKDDEIRIEDFYSTPIEKPMHDTAVFFQKYIGYCFDDLGTEEIKNNYGNKKNVMADIILEVYRKKDFEKFHITTNLNSDEIEAKYGSRVRSRLREMFNVFVLNGKDRRK